jgi:peptidyl-tRNA hydrolase
VRPAPKPAAPAADDPRDELPQYVLPLVLRLERDAPPQRTDALETAARAVLTLLADGRSIGEGEWAEAVEAWQDARIRKVVRRARGAEWRRASVLPGITVTGTGSGSGTAMGSSSSNDADPDPDPDPDSGSGEGSDSDSGSDVAAEVRVYPPIPLDGWPKDLARLQVSGTDLADDAPPPAPVPGVPVVWMNPAVEMTAGKAMAQAGHAAQLGWWRLDAERAAAWAASGFPLAVRTADPAHWARLVAADLPMVRDAGFTEIAPGTATAIAELDR